MYVNTDVLKLNATSNTRCLAVRLGGRINAVKAWRWLAAVLIGWAMRGVLASGVSYPQDSACLFVFHHILLLTLYVQLCYTVSNIK